MGLAAAALSGFCFGALAVAIRVALPRHPDPAAAGVVITTTAAVLAVAVALAARESLPSWSHVLPLALGGAVAPGLTQGIFVRAIRWAGPSRATIVSNVFPLFSVLIATVLLHERLTVTAAVGTVVIVLGGAVLVWDRAAAAEFPVRGAVLALVCALLFATRDNTLRYAVRGGEAAPVVGASISLVAAAIVSTLSFLVTARGGLRGRIAPAWRAFVPAGVLLALAVEGLLHAFAHVRVALAAPLVATQSLWAVALSVVAFTRALESIGWRLVASSLLIGAGSTLVSISR